MAKVERLIYWQRHYCVDSFQIYELVYVWRVVTLLPFLSFKNIIVGFFYELNIHYPSF